MFWFKKWKKTVNLSSSTFVCLQFWLICYMVTKIYNKVPKLDGSSLPDSH